MFLGTLYPLALEAVTGEKISVGAPFFKLTFVPLVVPLLLLRAVRPALAWKRGDLLGAGQRLSGGARRSRSPLARVSRPGAAAAPVAAPLGIGLGVFLILGSADARSARARTRRGGPSASAAPAPPACRARPGAARSRMPGVGLTVIGIAAPGLGRGDDRAR